jgi:hypothetical protein
MFTTSMFHYDANRKVLSCYASELGMIRFPETITITSDQTGQKVTFTADKEAAIAAEFWDGELMEYVPVQDGTPINAERLVIMAG